MKRFTWWRMEQDAHHLSRALCGAFCSILHHVKRFMSQPPDVDILDSSAQKGKIRSAFRNAVLLAGTERERFTFNPGLESKGTEWSLGPFLLRSMTSKMPKRIRWKYSLSASNTKAYKRPSTVLLSSQFAAIASKLLAPSFQQWANFSWTTLVLSSSEIIALHLFF